MAGRGQRGGGGGDRVLESRHLVGLFLGVVLLCGVFFTLGYVMGRNQFGGPVHAEDTRLRATPSPAPSAPKSKQSEPAPSSASGDWDFYGKSSSKNPDSRETAAGTRNAGKFFLAGSKNEASRFHYASRPLPAAKDGEERGCPAGFRSHPAERRARHGRRHSAKRISVFRRYAHHRQFLPRPGGAVCRRKIRRRFQARPRTSRFQVYN